MLIPYYLCDGKVHCYNVTTDKYAVEPKEHFSRYLKFIPTKKEEELLVLRLSDLAFLSITTEGEFKVRTYSTQASIDTGMYSNITERVYYRRNFYCKSVLSIRVFLSQLITINTLFNNLNSKHYKRRVNSKPIVFVDEKFNLKGINLSVYGIPTELEVEDLSNTPSTREYIKNNRDKMTVLNYNHYEPFVYCKVPKEKNGIRFLVFNSSFTYTKQARLEELYRNSHNFSNVEVHNNIIKIHAQENTYVYDIEKVYEKFGTKPVNIEVQQVNKLLGIEYECVLTEKGTLSYFRSTNRVCKIPDKCTHISPKSIVITPTNRVLYIGENVKYIAKSALCIESEASSLNVVLNTNRVDVFNNVLSLFDVTFIYGCTLSVQQLKSRNIVDLFKCEYAYKVDIENKVSVTEFKSALEQISKDCFRSFIWLSEAHKPSLESNVNLFNLKMSKFMNKLQGCLTDEAEDFFQKFIKHINSKAQAL